MSEQSYIVSAFYDNLVPEFEDTWQIRNKIIEIPGPDEGYTRTQLIGTTGVGKTTLVRQLMGTDPLRERFPSTSAAKTTVADIEIILASVSSPFKAVVTFFSRERIQQYIEECVAASIISQIEKEDVKELERKFLEHTEQRFRLSYLLGTSKSNETSNEEDELSDEEDLEEAFDEDSVITLSEKEGLSKKLKEYIACIQDLAKEIAKKSADGLDFDFEKASRNDFETFLELAEEEIYQNEGFYQLIDTLIDDVESKFDYDVESKFDYVVEGEIHRNKNWPSYWTFETKDRNKFIKTINKFSSNYAPNFGKLLTPLVDGIRAKGPFNPQWYKDDLKLVLMDGEGLGHMPNSASSLSTNITRKYKLVDAIIVVDNAAQPMQASSISALRSLVSSGHENKIIICFTHFDAVKGPNLPNTSTKRNHVRASLDSAIKSIGKDLGKQAENALVTNIDGNIAFLSGIQKTLNEKRKLTLSEFKILIQILQKKILPKDISEVTPIYDAANLVLTIQSASQDFHKPWREKLGIEYRANIRPEHWSRIKALSKRLGVSGEKQYDNLRPVADLIRVTSERIWRFIDNPLSVEPSTASSEMVSEAISNIAQEISNELHNFSSERLFKSKLSDWNSAYAFRGTGSTKLRARKIKDIYNSAVPIPGEIPSRDENAFLSEIRKLIKDGIINGGGKLKSE